MVGYIVFIALLLFVVKPVSDNILENNATVLSNISGVEPCSAMCKTMV
jgi:hypothetical protein